MNFISNVSLICSVPESAGVSIYGWVYRHSVEGVDRAEHVLRSLDILILHDLAIYLKEFGVVSRGVGSSEIMHSVLHPKRPGPSLKVKWVGYIHCHRLISVVKCLASLVLKNVRF